MLAILDCRECALAVGEGSLPCIREFFGFGALSTSEMKPEDVARGHAAVNAVKIKSSGKWKAKMRVGASGQSKWVDLAPVTNSASRSQRRSSSLAPST